MNGFTIPITEVNALTGRVFKAVDGLVYTITSVSTNWAIRVFDPRRHEFIFFDSKETFENWAYGTPVPAAASLSTNTRKPENL